MRFSRLCRRKGSPQKLQLQLQLQLLLLQLLLPLLLPLLRLQEKRNHIFLQGSGFPANTTSGSTPCQASMLQGPGEEVPTCRFHSMVNPAPTPTTSCWVIGLETLTTLPRLARKSGSAASTQRTQPCSRAS